LDSLFGCLNYLLSGEQQLHFLIQTYLEKANPRLKGEGQARESRREEEQDIPPLREAVTSSDSVNQAASLAAVKHSLVRCSSCQQLRFFLDDLMTSSVLELTEVQRSSIPPGSFKGGWIPPVS
jgi:hypothetical protein